MEEIRNFTDVESWTVDDVVNSFSDKPIKKNKISVPKYQRSLVWSNDQKKELIKSLKSGFPIGAILLYKQGNDGDNTLYSLIDGLQRSSTLRDYYQTPTKFFDKNNISDSLIQKIKNNFSNNQSIEKEHIEKIIVDWIQQLTKFSEQDSFSAYDLASELDSKLNLNLDTAQTKDFVNLFRPFIEQIKRESDISNIKVPIIIYSGDLSNLPDIFAKINSQGTQLSKYQIFAASWTTYPAIKIENKEIIQLVKAKYDALIDKGLQIDNYDPNTIENAKFSIFEYFFGLGKYLCTEFPELFGSTSGEDQDESIAFNIGAVCLGVDIKQMSKLPGVYQEINQVKFEQSIIDSIEFVLRVLKPYISLKANSKKTNVYHTEYQIVSIIGKVFHSKYKSDLSVHKTWNEQSKKLEKNIPYHYLYDIINENWRGSGDTKAKNYATLEKYENPISYNSWETTLNDWFETELQKKEKDRVIIKDVSILFLKYIYTRLISAYEELSTTEFEIEHTIPVKRLKSLAEKEDKGLPIGAISNLCLIKKPDNRKKGELTLYEYFDKEQNKSNPSMTEEDLERIEKYTFTTRADLDFSSSLNINNYNEFLIDRFNILKDQFYKLNNIE